MADMKRGEKEHLGLAVNVITDNSLTNVNGNGISIYTNILIRLSGRFIPWSLQSENVRSQ
jgi:hypothetical protein